jgi:glyoxylase-like metal-dependent hydrolase (beta-lactamase superfamily II)
MKNTALLQILLGAAFAGCATSSHPTQPSELGRAARSSELLAVIDQPGPLSVETVASADWAVPRSGLINLDPVRAVAAGLEDVDEPIQIFFHVIRHPERGLFIVDTGVERRQRVDPEHALIRGLLAKVMNGDALVVREALGDFLRKQDQPLRGVLLTHLHLDHITGMPDVPRGTPIYAGPGETTPRAFTNLFVQGVIDEALEGQTALREWSYAADADGRFAGVLDVFGDGSLWAIWVPGHTPGSTAYLARTAQGPVLFTGDASHTAWGWDHDVEPGTFSNDLEQSRASFAALRRLASEHPTLEVRLGHQHHGHKMELEASLPRR